MSSRHIARGIVLQSAFEWDFRNLSREQALEALLRDRKEFSDGDSEKIFSENLLKGVIDKKADLDSIITKAAPDWPLEKISVMDRNILRIVFTNFYFQIERKSRQKLLLMKLLNLQKFMVEKKAEAL
jgi:N utilization substance protein B